MSNTICQHEKRGILLRLVRIVAAVTFGGAMLSAHSAGDPGGSYPHGPITLVVPFGTGGFGDISGRLIAEALSSHLHQPVIVDSRAGASGAIGTSFVAKSAPNGYTLLVVSNTNLVVGPLLQPSRQSRLKDFIPIGTMAEAPIVLGVGSTSPYNTFAEFREAGKREPGKISISHAGDGSSNHLAILHLQRVLGTTFNPIPYKSPGQGLVDLMGGRVDAGVNQLSSSLTNMKAGKIKPLAVLAPERLKDFPQVQTLKELGYEEFPFAVTMGLAAPAGTPDPVIERLSTALKEVLDKPEVRTRFEQGGMVVRYSTPPVFQRTLARQQEIVEALIQSGKLKASAE